jgi:hypothetical protein
MANRSLEQRVAALEAQVDRLQQEARSAAVGNGKDWRRTIGVFTGDEGMQQILRDAMLLREADRTKVRAGKSSNR